MALMVIPDEGKLKLIDWMLPDDGTNQEDFSARLFQNNYTPVAGSTLADFTICNFTGYASVSILRADFNSPYIDTGVAYTDATTDPVYTCTGGSAQNAYGWYMVGVTSGKVIAAQRFNSVRSMAPGAVETLTAFRIGLATLH